MEALLQSNLNFKTTVIRFGGLLGEDRHPTKFLAGKTNVENPDAPVNLIQREDCIGIIEKILNQVEYDNWGATFNAVAPFHPTKKEYYTQKATDLNLALPKFAASNSIVGKTILNDKLIKYLQYSFIKPRL